MESYSRRFKSRKIRSSAERTAPPRSTHVQPGDVSSFLIQQGGEEKLRENSSSTTAWWQWSSWFSGRASLSTTEEEEELEEERAALGKGCGCPLSPSLYIGGRGVEEAP